MANYIISGAGSGGKFNGTFVLAGIYYYENILDSNYVLRYDSGSSTWVIEHYTSICYYNPASVGEPPLSGWVVALGSEPAPTIALDNTATPLFSFKNLFLKSSFDNNVSLYINSTGSFFGARTLYLQANTQEQKDLYLRSFPQNSINLFTKFWYEDQEGKDLYLKSLTESTIPFYLYNLPLSLINNDIDFNIYGSTINTQMKAIDLYINNITQENFNLFLLVSDIGRTTDFINFFINGNFESLKTFQSLNFYLSNEYKSIDDSLEITIIGLGTTFNGIPNNSSIEMFIQRDIEATWNSMPLIAYGSSLAVTNSINFNIYVDKPYFDSIYLVMPEVNQPFNGNIQLYTHGFEDATWPVL